MEQTAVEWLRKIIVHPCCKALYKKDISKQDNKTALVRNIIVDCKRVHGAHLFAIPFHSICGHSNYRSVVIKALPLPNILCCLIITTNYKFLIILI